MASTASRRNLGRISEIAQVAVKHGFGYFFERHKLTDLLPGKQRLPPEGSPSQRGQHLREMLDELRDTRAAIEAAAAARYRAEVRVGVVRRLRAVLLIDPSGRLVWSWSREGELVAGGTESLSSMPRVLKSVPDHPTCQVGWFRIAIPPSSRMNPNPLSMRSLAIVPVGIPESPPSDEPALVWAGKGAV